MRRHLCCLTVDTDPDGLNGPVVDRTALKWEGMAHAFELARHLEELRAPRIEGVPITWFIRVDGQLREVFGSSLYLLSRFEKSWTYARQARHELGWHPHLYRDTLSPDGPTLISEPTQACEELEQLWQDMRREGFSPTSFRNGEGWHTPETYAAVERMGFICDSSVIPGRVGSTAHPMDWRGAPNQPYFPDERALTKRGAVRALLEVPMNTWYVQAPYDREPRVRYMNPAIHESIFRDALKHCRGLEEADEATDNALRVWVFIFHPDEVMPNVRPDALYSRSIEAVKTNLHLFVDRVRSAGVHVDFATISQAALEWRKHGLAS